MSLFDLVTEAQAIAHSHPCRVLDHQWVAVGGRACPHKRHGNRSQTVFRCERCKTYDYGEVGGPGHAECVRYCGVAP